VRALAADRLLADLEATAERDLLRRIDLHGALVDVCAADEEAPAVLDFVFGRQATLGPPDALAAPWRVAAVRSDAQYEGWRREHAAHARGGTVPVKRWGGDFLAERVDLPDGVSLVDHREPFVGVTVFAADSRLVAYVRPEDRPLNVPHFEHSCKYPLRVQHWPRGRVEVHAAACSYRGRGVLLMGFRRAGKTTLAMHLMRRGGAMAGSDLGLLSADRGAWCLEAVPHMCRITPETVADSAFLRDALAPFGAMDGSYLDGPVLFDAKIELYAGALDAVFGRPASIARSRIDLVVLPAFDPARRERQRFEPLEPGAAGAEIARRLASDRPLPDWLPVDEVRRCDGLDAEAVQRLAACLPPAVGFSFGPSATLDWEAFDAEFDRLARPQRRGDS
jgi:hypothetical protein